MLQFQYRSPVTWITSAAILFQFCFQVFGEDLNATHDCHPFGKEGFLDRVSAGGGVLFDEWPRHLQIPVRVTPARVGQQQVVIDRLLQVDWFIGGFCVLLPEAPRGFLVPELLGVLANLI